MQGAVDKDNRARDNSENEDNQIDSGNHGGANRNGGQQPPGVSAFGQQQNNILQDRFKYGKQINEGCFGKVYEVVEDKQNTTGSSSNLVMKMQSSDYQYLRELQFLKLHTDMFYKKNQKDLDYARAQGTEQLNKLKAKLRAEIDFPLLVANGEQKQLEWLYVGKLDQFDESQQVALNVDSEFIVKYPRSRGGEQHQDASEQREAEEGGKGRVYQRVDKMRYYLVMDKFGDSLRDINDLFSNKFTVQTILQIGIQLVTILQRIHELGYVYNDLKPDNILVGDHSLISQIDGSAPKAANMDQFNLHKLRLIDFGLITPYLEADGSHIVDGVEDKFKGSMLFASKNSFNFVRTSRRDDLISLVYILVFFLDMGRLVFINRVQNKSKQNKFRMIKEAKMAMGPRELCGNAPDDSQAHYLLPFATLVFSYQFADAPDYNQLRRTLEQQMHAMGIRPGKNYDWTLDKNGGMKSHGASREEINASRRRREVAARGGDQEQISNESANHRLFDDICRDADRDASMQAGAKKIGQPNSNSQHLPRNQMPLVPASVKEVKQRRQSQQRQNMDGEGQCIQREEEDKYDLQYPENQPKKQSNNHANRSYQPQIMNLGVEVGDNNRQKVHGSQSVVPGNMHFAAVAAQQNSNEPIQNALQNLVQEEGQFKRHDARQKQLPQIQAIINSESNMGGMMRFGSAVANSVRISSSPNNNTTTQRRQNMPDLQRNNNQIVNSSNFNDESSVDTKMTNYHYETKSNHKFMRDNKGAVVEHGQVIQPIESQIQDINAGYLLAQHGRQPLQSYHQLNSVSAPQQWNQQQLQQFPYGSIAPQQPQYGHQFLQPVSNPNVFNMHQAINVVNNIGQQQIQVANGPALASSIQNNHIIVDQQYVGSLQLPPYNMNQQRPLEQQPALNFLAQPQQPLPSQPGQQLWVNYQPLAAASGQQLASQQILPPQQPLYYHPEQPGNLPQMAPAVGDPNIILCQAPQNQRI